MNKPIDFPGKAPDEIIKYINCLHQTIKDKESENKNQAAKINQLSNELKLLRHQLFGKKFRARSPENVVEEING